MTTSVLGGKALSFLRFEKLQHGYDDCGFLGAGSFGQVRKVRRRCDGRYFAIKTQPVDLDDATSTDLVNAESAILATITVSKHSRSLVSTEALLYDPPMLHIVMEYHCGGDLSKRIKARKAEKRPFTNAEAWAYFAQLVDALAELHSPVDDLGNIRHVVLHRDVKPGNVLIDKDGFLKLGDFGLSKLLIDDWTQTQCGTRAYMSPESLDGRPYSTKSDVYALGCLMHELCTFSLPFDRSYGSRDPRRVPSLPSLYDRQMDAMIKKMIAYSPDDRPSAAELKVAPQIVEQLTRVRQQRADLDFTQRVRDLEKRERALAQREHDLLSAQSPENGSIQSMQSMQDASLLRRQQDLDDRQAQLIESARILAQRVQATNAVLAWWHERLVILADAVSMTIGPQDDRESIFKALLARITDMQQRQMPIAGATTPNARPSVRRGATLLLDALQDKMNNLARNIQDPPYVEEGESEVDPMAVVQNGLHQIARNLRSTEANGVRSQQMPGGLPTAATAAEMAPRRTFSPTNQDRSHDSR